MPSGVRKPLMQESAGHSQWLWGFRSAVDVGVGVTNGDNRDGGCGQAASLRLGAVQPAPQVARHDPVGGDSHDRRARVRCRMVGPCGGNPKEIIDLGNGQKRGIDTQVYDAYEIERIAGFAFELACTLGNKVCSMENAPT